MKVSQFIREAALGLTQQATVSVSMSDDVRYGPQTIASTRVKHAEIRLNDG